VADLLFIAIIVAFFGVAVLLVRACDAIIGPDPAPSIEATIEPDEVEVVTSAPEAVDR
jgi:hypothetical protein